MPNWTYKLSELEVTTPKQYKKLKNFLKVKILLMTLIPEPDWTVTPLSELHEKNSISVKSGELGERTGGVDNCKIGIVSKFASTGQ